MKQLIAGNWKMNGLRGEAVALAEAVSAGAAGLGCDLVVCPPATVLAEVARVLAGGPVSAGGQECHAARSGAHTGDVSAEMLRDAGAAFVIVGHSERRSDHGDTDITVREKAEAAMAAGLVPIVCVGEIEAHRLSGRAEVVVASQVDGSIPAGFTGAVAYEPVWAIGTGRTATEADVTAMHAVIRATLVDKLGDAGRRVRILYGGSVKPGGGGGGISGGWQHPRGIHRGGGL